MNRPNPLREWRRARNLSAVEVARKLGLSEQTVFSYELGRFNPSHESIEALSSLMSIQPTQLRLMWHLWRKGESSESGSQNP